MNHALRLARHILTRNHYAFGGMPMTPEEQARHNAETLRLAQQVVGGGQDTGASPDIEPQFSGEQFGPVTGGGSQFGPGGLNFSGPSTPSYMGPKEMDAPRESYTGPMEKDAPQATKDDFMPGIGKSPTVETSDLPAPSQQSSFGTMPGAFTNSSAQTPGSSNFGINGPMGTPHAGFAPGTAFPSSGLSFAPSLGQQTQHMQLAPQAQATPNAAPQAPNGSFLSDFFGRNLTPNSNPTVQQPQIAPPPPASWSKPPDATFQPIADRQAGPALGPPSQADINALAHAGIGEARGQGRAGMQSVMEAIQNRADSNYSGFGRNVQQQIQAPNQFEYLENNNNRAATQAMNANSPTAQQALDAAKGVLFGTADRTIGARTDYRAQNQGKITSTPRPDSVVVGGHNFFKENQALKDYRDRMAAEAKAQSDANRNQSQGFGGLPSGLGGTSAAPSAPAATNPQAAPSAPSAQPDAPSFSPGFSAPQPAGSNPVPGLIGDQAPTASTTPGSGFGSQSTPGTGQTQNLGDGDPNLAAPEAPGPLGGFDTYEAPSYSGEQFGPTSNGDPNLAAPEAPGPLSGLDTPASMGDLNLAAPDLPGELTDFSGPQGSFSGEQFGPTSSMQNGDPGLAAPDAPGPLSGFDDLNNTGPNPDGDVPGADLVASSGPLEGESYTGMSDDSYGGGYEGGGGDPTKRGGRIIEHALRKTRSAGGPTIQQLRDMAHDTIADSPDARSALYELGKRNYEQGKTSLSEQDHALYDQLARSYNFPKEVGNDATWEDQVSNRNAWLQHNRDVDVEPESYADGGEVDEATYGPDTTDYRRERAQATSDAVNAALAKSSAAMEDSSAQDRSYRSSILPISRDAQGNTRFDASAGILGSLYGAAQLPGDVYAGRVDPMSEKGFERTQELAQLAMTGGFGGVPAKAGQAVLGSGPVRKALEVAAQQAPRELSPLGLYSHGAETAAGLQQAKGTPEQYAAMLQKAGVKPVEMEGFNEAFAGRPSVTREELAKHFNERMPQVEETVSGFNPRTHELYTARGAVRSELKGLLESDPKYAELWNKHDAFTREIESIGDTPTKFQQYTLPGSENYREVRLKLNRPQAKVVELEGGGGRWGVQMPDGTITSRYYEKFDAEQALRFDAAKQGVTFTSQHWDDPDVLAHLRMADRTGPNGEKILHLEEIQSDWAQKGRKEGFDKPKVDLKPFEADRELARVASIRLAQNMIERESGGKFNSLTEILDSGDVDLLNRMRAAKRTDLELIAANEAFQAADLALQEARAGNRSNIPTAPYVTNTQAWTDLALKRALKEAAEGGYDKLVWTPGAEQAKRYDLSKQVGKIYYDPELAGGTLAAEGLRPGQTILDKPNIKPENIADYIGKEAAEKLLAQPRDPNGMHMLEGNGLSMGGEGMKGYYDKIVPKRLQEIIKKHDPSAKVEMGRMPVEGRNKGSEDIARELGMSIQEINALPDAEKRALIGSVRNTIVAPSITITPKMRESILRGQTHMAEGGSVVDRALTLTRGR